MNTKNLTKKPLTKDVTLDHFFKLVESVAKKAKSDSASKKLIDGAIQKWQDDGNYAI